MAEPSWKVMEEKQDLEFHAQEDNRGGAEMLCRLPVLTTLLGLAGQQADCCSFPWVPQAGILFALCFPGCWPGCSFPSHCSPRKAPLQRAWQVLGRQGLKPGIPAPLLLRCAESGLGLAETALCTLAEFQPGSSASVSLFLYFFMVLFLIEKLSYQLLYFFFPFSFFSLSC